MTHVPPTPLSDTGSQFSLRQAFILLTFFSVAFAALALRMQWLTSAAKLQMTVSLLVAMCCAVLGYALSSLSNAHARKSAGTLIARTNTPVSQLFGTGFAPGTPEKLSKLARVAQKFESGHNHTHDHAGQTYSRPRRARAEVL